MSIWKDFVNSYPATRAKIPLSIVALILFAFLIGANVAGFIFLKDNVVVVLLIIGFLSAFLFGEGRSFSAETFIIFLSTLILCALWVFATNNSVISDGVISWKVGVLLFVASACFFVGGVFGLIFLALWRWSR